MEQVNLHAQYSNTLQKADFSLSDGEDTYNINSTEEELKFTAMQSSDDSATRRMQHQSKFECAADGADESSLEGTEDRGNPLIDSELLPVTEKREPAL